MNQVTTAKILERTLEHIAPLPSQQAYAHSLAAIFSMHIHRNQLIDDGIPADELPAPCAIVVAPTGQGKTYLVRKMAECLNLNIIIVDCGTLAAEGWKGLSLSQRLFFARREAKNTKSFDRSILFFDEIDKLHLWGTEHDQGNAMKNILQMFNGGFVASEGGRVNIDVSRFTILLGGAFSGIEDIIRDRVCPKAPIGFSSGADEKKSTAELMQSVTFEDLTKYGMMPELLGRVGTILTIPPLELEDYRQLLNAEAGSLHRKYNNYLRNLYGCTFEISDAGVEVIAQKCMTSATGARAVNPIVNNLMRSALETVENEGTICKVILDANEESCVIRYEHGPRAYAFRNPSRVESPWYTVRAKDPTALTRRLLRCLRNEDCSQENIPQLEAFLNCSLTYLYHKNPREFDFESLEQLARATRRTPVKSAFDIIMDDAHNIVPFAMRQDFSRLYTDDIQRNLTSSLQIIAAYLQERHEPCRIRFEIPREPKK